MGWVEFPTNFGLADAELQDQINHIYLLFISYLSLIQGTRPMSYDRVIQSKSRKLVNELDNNMRLIFKLSPSDVFPTQSFKDLHDLML